MHTKHLWVLLLCYAPISLCAQIKTDSVRQDKSRQIIISWSTGMLLLHQKIGRLVIGFPFTSSNTSTPGQFKGTLGNPFTQDPLLQDLFNIEFLSVHHSIDFHIGLIPNDDHRNSTYSDEYYIAGGYSHTFSIARLMMLKIGADVLFYQFSRELGKIDNENADVYALGYDSGPTFSNTYTTQYVTHTSTYTTRFLAVDFIQDVLAFAPSIRFTAPTSRTFYWGIQTSWFLPLIDKGGLDLTQSDGSGDRHSFQSRFQIIDLNQPGIAATFNGRPVDRSPYSLGGFYVGGVAGICLQTSHKQKHRAT